MGFARAKESEQMAAYVLLTLRRGVSDRKRPDDNGRKREKGRENKDAGRRGIRLSFCKRQNDKKTQEQQEPDKLYSQSQWGEMRALFGVELVPF